MDIALGARQERHLMRQRGAGARPIQGNFGFVFKAGPLQLPTQPPTQQLPKAIVETTEPRKETVLSSSNFPTLVDNVTNTDQPELSANTTAEITAQEEAIPEPEAAKPKRKAPKKRKALFTKKKPPTTRVTKNTIDKKDDGHVHVHDLSIESTATTVVSEKKPTVVANVKKPRLKGPSEFIQEEDDFIFRRRKSEKEANGASSQIEPAQESQPLNPRHPKRNATAIEELPDLPITTDLEHNHTLPGTLPKTEKAKAVAEIVLGRAHAEGTGKEKKAKAKTPSKRKREIEPLDPDRGIVGPAVAQLEPPPDAQRAKRGRKVTRKREDIKPMPQEDLKAEADSGEYVQADEYAAIAKKPAAKTSRARPARAETVMKIAEAEKETAEDVLIDKNSALVKESTKSRRGRKVADEPPIEAPTGEVIQDQFEEAPTSKRKPAAGARRTKKAVESPTETPQIELEQDPARHSVELVKEPAPRALRGKKASGKSSVHDNPSTEDPKDSMMSVQPIESESRAKAGPVSKARKGRKIAPMHPETPVPTQEEDLTKKISKLDRVPLAEQDANSSSPQKLSSGEKSAGLSELDGFADEQPKSKRARTTKAVTRAPRKASLRVEHTPAEELDNHFAKRENLRCVSKTAVADPAERDRRPHATKAKTSSDAPTKGKTVSAPKKSPLPKKRVENTTTRAISTVNKDDDEDMDAELFAPMSRLAKSSGISSLSAARKGRVKKVQNYGQQRVKAIGAQDEDVDLSDVFDGIAAIAVSSLKG